jgi:hypothetical protein
MKKNMKKNLFCILKVTGERSQDIKNKIGRAPQFRPINLKNKAGGSRSALKCHGSPTLVSVDDREKINAR